MNDRVKTKTELAEELSSLKQKIKELEQSESDRKKAEEERRESEQRLHLKLSDIPSPDHDAGGDGLRNIIDSQAIQSIMDDFYSLTGIGAAAILDLKGDILVATGWRDICTRFHRVHPETATRCTESDLALSQGVPPGEIKGYKCKNGLWDFVTPIFVGGKHMGNFYLGQFFFEDDVPDYDLFDRQADQYGFDKTEYRAALNRVPRWSREQVNTVMRFYRQLVDMVSRGGYSNLKLADELTERKRTEEALRESEKQYRELIDGMTETVWVIDFNGDLIDVNKTAVEFLGYSKEELLAIGLFGIDSSLTKDNIKALAGTMPSDKLQVFETSHRTKDGRTFPVEVCSSLVTYQGKRAILSIARNITDRRQVEAALRESEEKYRLWVENAGEAISLAQDGMHKFLNRRAFEILGYSKEELTSRPFTDFVHPDDREMVRERYLKRMNNEEVPNIYPLKIIAKDGTVKWIEIHPTLASWEGKPASLNFFTDITERKRTEEALKENEKKYRLLADNVNDVIFILDMNLHYTYVSPSVRILRGYEPEEVLKQHPVETLTPSSRDMAMRTFSEIMELGKSERQDPLLSRTLQLEVMRKDGTTVWTEVKFSFVRDDDLQPVGILGVTRDITDRRRVEAARARLLQILECSLNEIYVFNAISLVFEYVNRGALHNLGYTVEAMQNMTPLDLKPEFTEASFRKTIAPLLHHEQEQIILYTVHRRADGSLYPVEVHLQLVEIENQRLILAVILDITERKRAEEELQNTLESLRKAVGTTIQVMVSAVETRDPYTAGHQIRAANLARAIAAEMGLPREKIESIHMVGSIHDIGKLSIPAEILSKPTRLTDIEFSLVKEHPRKGYEILQNVESSWPLAEIVYQHHERTDGSGYPRNLKGDEILMEARILAVSDVVESMASHRPYRPALGLNAALEEIEKKKGSLYDADAVEACLRLFREKGYQL